MFGYMFVGVVGFCSGFLIGDWDIVCYWCIVLWMILLGMVVFVGLVVWMWLCGFDFGVVVIV